MNGRFLIVIPVFFCAVLLGVGLNAHRLPGIADAPPDSVDSVPSAKIYTHEVAEGMSIQSGALPGVRLVEFDSCRIEKQRKGGFSFGAFNILVIDQLKIAIPRKQAGAGGEGGLPAGSGFNRDDLEIEFRKILSAYPRFSALEIRGLSVDLAGRDGGLVRVLEAGLATAGRNKTLELSTCEFLTDTGSRIRCGKASMALEPPFAVSTEQGAFRVAGLLDGRDAMFARYKQGAVE
ncbi:hypothetical protein [Pontiella desulfatans]|uniref:hypothetical protein n=1 Tax=Pontiella desulfatans TaxID=2750659 RepID=UPI00109C6DD5|nr:hypothetical protein [Pontiella desulfatans]